MRRAVFLAFVLTMLMLVPATSDATESCPSLDGKAFLDFGRTGTGMANLVYDGDRIRVDFVATGFAPTPTGADIFFDWFFPDGTVSIVEHSAGAPGAGPLFLFDSTIDVIAGGGGSWTWSGIANGAGGVAVIQELSGSLCIGT